MEAFSKEKNIMVETDEKKRLLRVLDELRSNPLTRPQKIQELLSLADSITRSEEGLIFVHQNIGEIIDAGIFSGTPWEDPHKLVPSLVKGTLVSGFPNNVIEILSELRMVYLLRDKRDTPSSLTETAQWYLEETLISTFDLAFHDHHEESRVHGLTPLEQQRIRNLFEFIMLRVPVFNLREKLAQEIDTIAAQRLIDNRRLRHLIRLVRDNFDLKRENSRDRRLLNYVDALFHPTQKARELGSPDAYSDYLKQCDRAALAAEAKQTGKLLPMTGIASPQLYALLHAIIAEHSDLFPKALGLNAHGTAEYSTHFHFIRLLVHQFLSEDNRNAIYGLGRMLERNLFSRKPVWNALNKLIRSDLHPQIRQVLMHGEEERYAGQAHRKLICGCMQVLGLPLGIRQGNNPTCQSARGLSMWSNHSPAKLLNMVISAATYNELNFRYEGELIRSQGQHHRFDLSMDTVSMVLVPHLDHIYQTMMQKAALKHPGNDPHVSVNPAFYGSWIHTGFISVVDHTLNMVVNYGHFVRILYASFHPEYNDYHRLVYPVPLGIFITNSHGEMLGFHAVSLLRTEQDEHQVWRAYFYNPNNEGRQDWGQGIRPSVNGNGEKPGESSLPFDQFCSRVYAFHFNSMGIEERLEGIESTIVNQIEEWARKSWGQSYIWQS